MAALQNIGFFLVNTLFSLYIGAVILRFLLAWVRASFYNPISQFLVKITNPVLAPLRRVIPATGKIDTAAIALALALTVIKLVLLNMLGYNNNIIFGAILDLLETVIHIYIFALIVQAIMSWVGNSYGNPLADLLHSLTEPLLRPVRQVVPVIGMIDLSPMIAVLILYVILIALNS